MKNIKDIAKDYGIEEGKLDEFEKAVLENYRTKAELDGKAAKVSELEEQLKAANEAIEAAKTADTANADELTALKEKLEAYENDEKARAAAKTEEAAKAEFEGKLAEAVGDKEFANDIVKAAVTEKAYAMAKANPNMDVKAIVSGIVGEAAGVWKNPQQDPKKMPAQGSANANGTGAINSLEDLKSMSVDEIRAHMKEVDSLLAANR